MSTSQFRDAIAALVLKGEKDAEAQSALNGIKAVIGAEAYALMVVEAREYNSKVGEREAAKVAQQAEREREKQEWMAAHGTIVMREYAVLEEARRAVVEQMANLKADMKSYNNDIHDLLVKHGAVVYDENGETKVRQAGHRSGNGAAKSTETRTTGQAKVWVDSQDKTYPSFAAACIALGYTVGADSGARVLKNHNHTFGKIA